MKRKFKKNQRLSLPVMTFLMLLLAACTPAIPDLVEAPVATPHESTPISSQVPQVIATDNQVPATEEPAPALVATSRGPNLVATDPSTVNLASSQLQLVEFFRFT
ncbi:MAG: hypothetical protein ABIJ65_12160 [Chloroflexota bacterium]